MARPLFLLFDIWVAKKKPRQTRVPLVVDSSVYAIMAPLVNCFVCQRSTNILTNNKNKQVPILRSKFIGGWFIDR